jgi:hypothetical protein
VLSDLYAMGVVACHNMLMLLAVSREFTDQERDVVVPLLMKGFQVNVLEYVSDSVADPDPNPDPPDPRVFGPPGSGSGSISQRYGSGSGSFYH